MQNLYTTSTKREVREGSLTEEEKFSVIYHNLFDFPLSFSEMIRWRAGDLVVNNVDDIQIVNKNGYYFVGGKEGIVYKKILRKRISAKKLEVARKAAKALAFLPGVKMIAVTGSLAMDNSTDESDIDLMIITKAGSLWTTRLFAYMVIHAFGFSTRKPNDLYQSDKLCLNMWLDEGDLVWTKKDRNVYTAHEIGQIRPLVNKDKAYEKFIYKNKWILDFWPNSVKISKSKNEMENEKYSSGLFEKLCYWLQYQHMKSKITREIVSPTRALFHPQDWGKVVLSRLK